MSLIRPSPSGIGLPRIADADCVSNAMHQDETLHTSDARAVQNRVSSQVQCV